MLSRVQAMLARAASTEFEAEAEECRKKANALMMEYSIEEYELVVKGDKRPEVTFRKINIEWYHGKFESDVRDALWAIFCRTAEYCRTMLAPHGSIDESGEMRIGIVGTAADIDYFELMFTNLFMECVMRMQPKANAAKPLIENLVALKEVGHKWEYIGGELFAIGQLEKPYTRNTGVRFTKLYSDYCKAHNRDQVRTSPDLFKRSFVNGFMMGVTQKIKEMMEENNREFDTGGVGLVLRDMMHDVRDFWKIRYPEGYGQALLRGKYRPVNYDHAAVARGVNNGREAAVIAKPGEGVQTRAPRELR